MELDIKQGGLGSYILRLFNNKNHIFQITLAFGYYFFLCCFSTGVFLILNTADNKTPALFTVFIFLASVFSTVTISLIAKLSAFTLIKLNPNGILHTLLIPLFSFFILFFPVSWLLLFTGQLSKLSRNKNISLIPSLPFSGLDQWSQKQLDQGEPIRENQELKMFQNALEFPKIRIRDCMIPRTEIEAIEIYSSLDAVKKKFIDTGYSKIIVYQGTTDNIVGYISSKELFKHPASIKERLTEIAFVPETMPASKMLHEFMQYHRSIAVVVDEYGGISGMITLEDIIEEIFGEIEDEHDTDHWVEKQIRKNEFVLSGRLEIEYLNTEYQIDVKESEEYDTLAGFILYHHHTLPKKNEIIEIDQFSFKILKVSNTRIELVYLKILEPWDLKKSEHKQKKNTL